MRPLRSVIPAEPFGARLYRLAAPLRDMAAAGLPGVPVTLTVVDGAIRHRAA